MGKLVTLITMLIFIDILFVMTGQLALSSSSSVIITAMFSPADIMETNFWALVITSLVSLGAVAGIVAGLVTRNSDIAIFFAMAGTLALLVMDYVAIYRYLFALNNLLALIVLGPIVVIFSMVILEWARGKD